MWCWTLFIRNWSENRDQSRYLKKNFFFKEMRWLQRSWKHLQSQRGEGKITQRSATIGTTATLGRRSQSTLRAVALCCQVLAVPVWLWAQEPRSLLLRALLPRHPPAPYLHPTPWLLLPLVHCCISSRNQTSAIAIPPKPWTMPFISRT